MVAVKIDARSATATSGRRGERRPVFRAGLELEPWEITPFCCFPMLPGETLHNIMIDGRFMVNGCVSPVYPWYLDLQLFAVRLRDLDIDFEAILLNDTETPPAGLAASTTSPFVGEALNGISVSQLVYNQICANYWDVDGEVKASNIHTDLNKAPVKWRTSSSTLVEGETPSAFLKPEDIVSADMKADLIADDLSWRDVLRQYGVREKAEASGVPELIMWKSIERYPVFLQSTEANTIVARYQVLWQLREARLTQRGQGIFAKEPMAVMGLVTIRPEIIEGNKDFFCINDLIDRERWWVPPFNTMDAVQDIRQEPHGTGWVDTGPGVTSFNALDYWFMGESFTSMNYVGDATLDPQLDGHLAESPRRTATPVFTADFIGAQTASQWPVMVTGGFVGGHVICQTRIKTHLAAIA